MKTNSQNVITIAIAWTQIFTPRNSALKHFSQRPRSPPPPLQFTKIAKRRVISKFHCSTFPIILSLRFFSISSKFLSTSKDGEANFLCITKCYKASLLFNCKLKIANENSQFFYNYLKTLHQKAQLLSEKKSVFTLFYRNKSFLEILNLTK